MMKIIKYCSLPILLLIAPTVFAGMFDPPTTDKSIEYLGGIFGDHVGSIYLGGAANPVLISMFSCFNTIILSIGVIILSYIGLVSTINTAHEGEAMGKKWSSIWLPMRSILGMLLMVPTPAAGYSLIQVIVLWLIIQGIGAADKIWNIALTNLADGISVTQGLGAVDASPLAPSTPIENAGKTLAKNLLNSLVCKKSIENLHNHTATNDKGLVLTFTLSDFVTNYGSRIRLYSTTTKTLPENATTVFPAPSLITHKGSFNIGAEDYTATTAATAATAAAYQQICGNYEINGSSTANELTALGLSDAALTTELLNYATTAYETKMLAINAMIPLL